MSDLILRVVMVTSNITDDIDSGLELDAAPTVILQGSVEAIKAAAIMFGEQVTIARALPAVQPTHVNETPKSEHEDADMLTPDREAALREAAAMVETGAMHGGEDTQVLLDVRDAILALIDKPDAHLVTGPKCECGMTGPCMWSECKSPILAATKGGDA